MKKLILLLVILLPALALHAQDIITLKNGSEIKGKIIEVSGTQVRYKKADNPDGPLYTIDKNEVFMITYPNGSKDVFGAAKTGGSGSKSNPAPDIESTDRVHYNGPRAGLTFFGPGSALDGMKEMKGLRSADYLTPLTMQFGWQFETRFFTLPNGASGLVEFIPLVGGLDKGLFLPSATLMAGFRGAKGLEFGFGPTLSRSGFGLAMAAGTSFTFGKVVFPVNLAFSPSVVRRETVTYYDPATQLTQTINKNLDTGIRFTLLIGFNTRKN